MLKKIQSGTQVTSPLSDESPTSKQPTVLQYHFLHQNENMGSCSSNFKPKYIDKLAQPVSLMPKGGKLQSWHNIHPSSEILLDKLKKNIYIFNIYNIYILNNLNLKILFIYISILCTCRSPARTYLQERLHQI